MVNFVHFTVICYRSCVPAKVAEIVIHVNCVIFVNSELKNSDNGGSRWILFEYSPLSGIRIESCKVCVCVLTCLEQEYTRFMIRTAAAKALTETSSLINHEVDGGGDGDEGGVGWGEGEGEGEVESGKTPLNLKWYACLLEFC